MAMSKAAWSVFQEVVENGGRVTLDCDGYALTVSKSVAGGYAPAFLVEVNGRSNAAMLIRDCEERRRFMAPVVRKMDPERMAMLLGLKSINQEELAELGVGPDGTLVSYSAFWNDLNQLRAHLQKNNSSISIK